MYNTLVLIYTVMHMYVQHCWHRAKAKTPLSNSSRTSYTILSVTATCSSNSIIMALSEYPNISKSIKLDDGTQYAYVYIEPATSSKPTFLFLHGFPSSSYDWRHQIEALRTKGFGILAPDLLGYGDSDSPSAVEPYALKRMSDHLAEILVKQGVRKVIGVGHDW